MVTMGVSAIIGGARGGLSTVRSRSHGSAQLRGLVPEFATRSRVAAAASGHRCPR